MYLKKKTNSMKKKKIDKAIIIVTIISMLSMLIILSCKDFGNDFFHIKKEKSQNDDPITIILNDFKSKNINKKRNAIIKSSKLKLSESEPYLREIILNSAALLNNRFLASKSYVEIFGEKAIDLANVLTLDYEYTDTSVAVELVYYIIHNENINIDTIELKFQFESLFLYHFKRSSSFRIKSKTMLTLSLLGNEEIIPLIEDKLLYNNPILGETTIALSRLLDKDNSKLTLNKLKTKTIEFLKKTRDDNLRRLLRKALYIIKKRNKIKSIEENIGQDNENADENINTTTINKIQNQIINIQNELLNTVSDLGSSYMIIALKAEEKIKNNIEKYKSILFESLNDTEDIIIYKTSAILSEFAFTESCSVITNALSNTSNNQTISPKSEFYIPTLKNLIRLSGKSQCEDAVPILKALLSNKALKGIIMASFTYYPSTLIEENNIEIMPVEGSEHNPEIFQYLQHENKKDELISLLTIENKSIATASIYYLKQTDYENDYELVKQAMTKAKDEEIKNLIKYHLIDMN